MIDIKIFYHAFQINYFDYKLAYLTYAEGHYKELNQENNILNYSEKDFVLAIKSDIRQTLFQAIETLFEVIFALLPDENGKISDIEIMRTLSKGDFPYKKIQDIVENKKNLEFLDKQVKLSSKKIVSLGEYVFYHNITATGDYVDRIKVSLEAIKSGLYALAKEFSDRKEYNCYKHGLRLVPAMNFLKIARADNMKQIANFDLSNSLTYYTEDEKQGKIEFVTKVFDTERDKRLIQLCSGLLWNIIKIRDVAINKLPNNQSGSCQICFFDNDMILKSNKVTIPMNNFRLTVTRSKDM